MVYTDNGYLEHCASFDEVLLQNIIKARIQFLLHVLNQQRSTKT